MSEKRHSETIHIFLLLNGKSQSNVVDNADLPFCLVYTLVSVGFNPSHPVNKPTAAHRRKSSAPHAAG
jgi:hypothetical protein